jgi:tripartite-type tricarboxylate transporter receptor subunit TctC
MTTPQRRWLRTVLLLCMMLPPGLHSWAQSLGNRPVKIVVPYTPAGPADLATRALAEGMAPLLGVPVVVENKPGATGKIAAELVARAEPDGHTLLAGGTPQYVILPLLDKTISYKPLDDFRMVSLFCQYDIVFMTGASTGIKTMKELLAKMQDKKDDVTFASIGQPELTAPGLAYLAFSKLYNGTARPIVYAGQQPGMIDLMAGRVTFAAYTLTGALPQIQAGKLNALAVASPQRLSELPDTPTMAELGYAEFMQANNWVSWVGLSAPAKTPDSIVNQINRAAVQAAQSDAYKAKLANIGLSPKGTGSAKDDQAEWVAEHNRLAGTLKRLDIKLP